MSFPPMSGSLVYRIRRLLPESSEEAFLRRIRSITAFIALMILLGFWQVAFGQVSLLQVHNVAAAKDGSTAKDPAAETSRFEQTDKQTHTDWPQWGRTSHRNNVADGPLPIEWNLEDDRNVVWKVKLGNATYSSPVVAGGKVFIGTNNGAGLNPAHPKEKDMSCLVCFDEATGLVLWQYASEKLSGVNSQHDLRDIGLCSTACIGGDRLWIVTNRCEVVCLDANGFRDGQNDGPFCDERSTTEIDADVVWKYDIFGELGVRPRHQSVSNVTVVDGVLLLNTSNGPDKSYVKVPAPDAPSFLALDAATGHMIWKDSSAGESIVIGGSSAAVPGASPAVAILGGVAQAVFTCTDGWVYAYNFDDLKLGRTTLLWRFDCNPKTAAGLLRTGRRNTLMGSPVVADGFVYVATGRDPEYGDGPADLWCIDPSKRGDLSSELVFNNAYAKGLKPIPFKPFCVCETFKGDFVRPNPNSGAIWHFASADLDNNGEIEFEETFHRSLGSPVIHDGLLFIADAAGLLFCLDSSTGEVQWSHDLMACVQGTCVVADGYVLIGDENGTIEIFKADRTKQSMLGDVPRNSGGSIYGTAAVVGGTLFIASENSLVAIRNPTQGEGRKDQGTQR